MIKLKSKLRKGTYEIIKVDDDFKECGNIYEDGIPLFNIYKPLNKKFESKGIKSIEKEKLTARYEIRITETEKKIITALRNKGVNISEEMRHFIITLDEEIASELNQVKYEQFKDVKEKILSELKRMNNFKNEYQYLRGETPEEAKYLTETRENIRQTIEFLEKEKKKIDVYLEKYKDLIRSLEHPKG